MSDISKPKIDEIDVEVRILDEIIPIDSDIKFIKIDVEGGEMGVLEGSIKTIQRCQPIILFEFGMGASDIYGTKPSDIFDYFENLDYKIYCLSSYLEKKEFLDFDSFDNLYNKGIEYYFVATLS